MIFYECRLLRPDGTAIAHDPKNPAGWLPTTKERYEFARDRDGLKHQAFPGGIILEYRAIGLVAVKCD